MADVMEEKKEELIPELKVETIPLETPATEVALEEKNVDVIAPMLELESIDAPVVQAMDKQDEEAFRMEKFSPEEIKQVNEYADKINLRDSNVIVSYGIGAQKHLSEFSDETLKQVRNKDLGAIGEELSHLMADLKYQPSEKKGFLSGIFGKSANKAETLKAYYGKVETGIDSITESLEAHRQTLLKDIAIYDKLYENNKIYFKELTMYIAAGKLALQKARNEDLPALKEKAAKSGLAEDAQDAKDYASMCDRFEKKIYDLNLTRTVCLQNAPQIRLLQSNAVTLNDKIQTAIINTIPMWKNQLVISLGVAHGQEAVKAQRMVSDTTNEILKKNAEMLHQGTVDIATENERGIVDLETLQHTNEELIATIDDLMKVQEEGRAKRQQAEAELVKIENQLKEKMLQASQA